MISMQMDIFGLALMNLHLQFVLFVFKTPTNVSCPPPCGIRTISTHSGPTKKTQCLYERFMNSSR